MSYSIYIGEAQIQPLGANNEPAPISVGVGEVRLPDAPTFPGDTMTGNSNGRHPGYAQWSKFCDDTGLDGLFFARDEGFLSSHPGCFKLLPIHLATVQAALATWKAKRPTMVPGWCECGDCHGWRREEDNEPHRPERDGHMARLLWLEWWMDWALRTCRVPAVSNT